MPDMAASVCSSLRNVKATRLRVRREQRKMIVAPVHASPRTSYRWLAGGGVAPGGVQIGCPSSPVQRSATRNNYQNANTTVSLAHGAVLGFAMRNRPSKAERAEQAEHVVSRGLEMQR